MTEQDAAKSSSGLFTRKSPLELLKDLIGGIIVALISIPISMGYAQIAGLPMQYGLYGSVLPILLFGLLTTSRDFVFGVDAAPAALVGTTVAALGIQAESAEAVTVVPVTAFLTSCWLLLFYLLRAGKMVRYISESVMGGFVSGICCTIILMQIPKLFGAASGIGEAPELIKHIVTQLSSFNPVALTMGLSVIFIIVLFRHIAPKIPMSVLMMAAGVAVTCMFPVADWGVRLLPKVEGGVPLPSLSFAGISADNFTELLFDSLSIAAVILAESLLASKSNAVKDGYELKANREILGYAAANFAASLTGCCPVNGSVSRTGIVRQFGVRSQWMSVFASLTMLIVLLFGTGFIELLPVPILTAIVISALSGACEFRLARHLWKTDKREFLIFLAAFAGVLIFGTVYGVVIGIVLSFIAVIIRAVTPPRAFLGIIPEKEGFYSLERHREAKPLKNVVIYRFGGNLFFANTEVLKNDLKNAVNENTRCIIIHAGAVGSVDVAAAEELVRLYRYYRDKKIGFYITEHIGELNDSLRKFGAGELIRNGAVRMTVTLALRDAGIAKPYEPAMPSEGETVDAVPDDRGLQAELDWALGEDAENFKKKLTEEVYQSIKQDKELSADSVEQFERLSRFGRLNLYDEDELLDRLETRLLNRAVRHPEQAEKIEAALEERRRIIESRMPAIDAQALHRIRKRRLDRARALYKTDPQTFEQRRQKRLAHLEMLEKVNPKLAKTYREVYKEILTADFEETEKEKPDREMSDCDKNDV